MLQKIDDYTEIKHFCPESKFAQRAPVDTFVGMSHNSIFMVDPRLPGNKQVKEQMWASFPIPFSFL
jgi:hypothetical protein